MEWHICRCEACGRFLAKIRILDVSDKAKFSLNMVVKCYNRDCKLNRDGKKRGENNITIATK